MSVKTKRSHEFCTGMLATSSRVAITEVENLYQSSVQIRHLISTLWLNFGCEECKRPQWDFSGYQQLFKELKCWLKKKRGKNKKSAALHTKSDSHSHFKKSNAFRTFHITRAVQCTQRGSECYFWAHGCRYFSEDTCESFHQSHSCLWLPKG